MFSCRSNKYAEELNDIFKELKWQPGIVNKSFLDDTKEDIAITATSDDLIPASNEIIKTLNEVGIKTSHEAIRSAAMPGGLKANTIYLVIGTKK